MTVVLFHHKTQVWLGCVIVVVCQIVFLFFGDIYFSYCVRPCVHVLVVYYAIACRLHSTPASFGDRTLWRTYVCVFIAVGVSRLLVGSTTERVIK